MTLQARGPHAGEPAPVAGASSADAFVTLDSALQAWRWLYACGLTSKIVCATLFRRWQLCSCGRCDDNMSGGAQ